MRDGEWVRFVIHFEVLDLARFREMATAMVAVSADEAGTVVYDWYVDEAAGRGTLYEAYASSEALGAAAELPRRDVPGAPTTWWGAPIAAVTTAG